MSMLNDALKQAKQTQQDNPPPTPPLQFRPVEPGQPNHSRAPLLFVGLAFALILVVALGGMFVWLVSQKAANELRVAARSTNEPATAVTADAKPAIVAPLPPALPPAPLPVEPGTNTLPATATAEPPQPLAPKLQGISFHPTRPLAVVNGKSVLIGDRVSGFRVLAIARSSVTLGSATATNVLSLSE
jgi:hypothetical protein